MKMKKKIGICFGTFDLVHPWHLHFLNDARKLVDHLTVIIARDITVEKVKSQKPMFSEDQRLQAVKDAQIADAVVLGSLNDKFEIILQTKPDIIILGYDQRSFVDELYAQIKNFDFSPEIVRLEAYKEHIYKSSLMKEKLK